VHRRIPHLLLAAILGVMGTDMEYQRPGPRREASSIQSRRVPTRVVLSYVRRDRSETTERETDWIVDTRLTMLSLCAHLPLNPFLSFF